LKRLAGNPGRRPLNDSEPQFRKPGRMLNVPDYLHGRAADVWRELGKMLLDAGLFTVVDKYALAMFCAAAGRWMDAEIKLRRTGGPILESDKGNVYQNPALHVANKAWDQMRKMFGEFGLTPAERSRLTVQAEEQGLTLAEQLFQMTQVDDGD
jgi:P27 family predicted phage terminase small subunit